MNLRLLIPCAGLAGGAFAGWFTRPVTDPGRAAGSAMVNAAFVSNTHSGKPAADTARTAAPSKAEVLDICAEKDGELTLYERLASVPARDLLTLLSALSSGDSLQFSPDAEESFKARNALVERLAEQDPVALAKWLLDVFKLGGSGWHATAMRALLDRNPPGAAEIIDRLDLYAGEVRLKWLLRRGDPEAALRTLLAAPQRSMPAELVAWLVNDPARAQALSNQHPEWSYAIMAAVANQGGAALEQFAAGLTNPDAQKYARQVQLNKAAAAAAGTGDIATLKRLMEQTGGDQTGGFPEFAFGSLARDHPEKAETLARECAGEPGIVLSLLSHLADRHPERAAAFLKSSPLLQSVPGQFRGLRDGLIQSLATSWPVADSAAAVTWLRTLPDDQRAAAFPAAFYIADHLPPEEWFSLSRGLPVDREGARCLAGQSVERSRDPAVLADYLTFFPDEYQDTMLNELRYALKNPAVADEVSRLVKDAPPTETP